MAVMNKICIFLLIVVKVQGAPSEYPRVTLNSGEIEGRLVTTKSGTQGYAYQGVPYVEPPLGKLRFANPVPKSNWNGTLICHDYKPACPLNSSTTRTHFDVLDEDCLYMNVFVGIQCNAEKPCPVLYYVHGGGYEYDGAPMFDPDVLVENFASKSTIYVTVGYRIGVLGFWSTGTEEAIGNWAMQDIVEGTRWVQREISNFGGDRKRVTIVGHSASAMAVSLLTMSPKTVGLFQQAIIMSGTSCRDDSMNNDVGTYQKLAVHMNCASEKDWHFAKPRTLRKIIDCMRQFDGQTLVNEFNFVRENSSEESSIQMTVPRNDGPNGLFPYPLDQLIAQRRPIRTMTGTTKYEKSTNVKDLLINATALTAVGMCDVLIEEMQLDHATGRQAEKACINEYVFKAHPNKAPPVSSTNPYSYWTTRTAGMMDDQQFFAPCHKEVVSLATKGSTVYLYSFDYEKSGQEGKTPFHSFDLVYINGLHMFPFDDRDREIQRLYLFLFVNFLKYGNPTPGVSIDNFTDVIFEPVGVGRNDLYNYLSVDIPLMAKPDYHKSSVILWNYKVPGIIEQNENPFAKSASGEQTDIGQSNLLISVGLPLFVVLCLSVVILGTVVLIVRRKRKFYSYKNDDENATVLNQESTMNMQHYETFSD